MHNPHAGQDSEKKGDEYDYEESDGEAEDSRAPVALVTSHSRVLLPSDVKAIGVLRLVYMLEKKRSGDAVDTFVIRLRPRSGVADLALLYCREVRRLESALPSPHYDADEK